MGRVHSEGVALTTAGTTQASAVSLCTAQREELAGLCRRTLRMSSLATEEEKAVVVFAHTDHSLINTLTCCQHSHSD